MKKLTVYINDIPCKASEGESVLQIAIRNNIHIPHFCYHEDLPVDGNCRTCLVEVTKVSKDAKPTSYVTTSCTLKAQNGMKVLVDSKKVKPLRKENMELLLAEHTKMCEKCKNGYACKTRDEMKRYGVTGEKYKRDNAKCGAIHKMGTAAEFDPKMCINCTKCIEMCEKIGIGFLKLEGNDSKTRISYTKNPHVDCIYCGQCTVHCPVSAVREQSHIKEVEKVLKDKSKIVIVQTAPSVRASIGEEFDIPYGTDLTGKLCTAYRMLGFDKVFDVNMGADITTIVEAAELVERIKKGGVLPMFTSCCPGWVKFLEFYHPEMIPHLTTARSPQIHSGGAYKTWWASKEGIDPKKIVIVSTMPCTSKKYEASHKKLLINGMKPVDLVLTTRELAIMLKKHKIDLKKLKPSKVDREGTYSGAAAIYGASGGVMESALRTAYFDLMGKNPPKIEFNAVRGMKGIKTANIKIGKINLKVAVVATAKNASIIIAQLKKNPHLYDYIEFMACPGGCIGGGGQPIPSTNKIVQQRINGIYKIDDKMKLRTAHENTIVKEFFEWVNKLPKKEQSKILHTHYSQKKKFE